ncbi:MAG: hypothetical protein HY559_01835 [Gammaproteobacteria bacterium]|nr:hypothetical protein [Gammaproteobacteria bacterium]
MEELIDGCMVTKADFGLLERLIQNLFSTYIDYGIVQQAANHLFPPNALEIITDLVKQVLGGREFLENYREFFIKLKTLITEDISLSYSIGHGDLYLGDIMFWVGMCQWI